MNKNCPICNTNLLSDEAEIVPEKSFDEDADEPVWGTVAFCSTECRDEYFPDDEEDETLI